jgi:ADP-heptose:LPS heptosyltransferase
MSRIVSLFGRRYLTGRRMSLPMLGLLVARDLALSPFLTVKIRGPISLAETHEICVCKLDHLGDLLMAVPTIQYLRQHAPQAKITLVVGEWSRGLAGFLEANGWVDRVIFCDLALLNRGRINFRRKLGAELRSRIAAIRALRHIKIDLILDFRPFSPNAWSLIACSGAKYRVGFGLRGMSFCYHWLAEFSAEKAAGQMFLDAVAHLGGEREIYSGPVLPSAVPFAERVLPVEKPARPYLVIQLYSAEDKRNVPIEYWTQVLEGLRSSFRLVIIGSQKEGERAARDFPNLSSMYPLFGKTSIPELIRLVEESAGVISVDSLSPHVGLGLKKRVAVLSVEGFSNRSSFPEYNAELFFFSHEEARPDRVIDLFCRPAAVGPAEIPGTCMHLSHSP